MIAREPTVTEAASRTDADTSRSRCRTAAAGLVLAGAVATAATATGRFVPVLGAPVIALVLGVLLSRPLVTRPQLQRGIAAAGGSTLQVAVVVLGAQLPLAEVLHVGAGSLPVMIGSLATCLALAGVAGRSMKIHANLRILIGIGTGICGASAIAAISPLIRAKSNEIAYAISTIFLFNVAAVLCFPPLGHLLGLSQQSFGLFAGTAINDTSSVVAAAASYGTAAWNYAVVVKLTRTLMIVPLAVVINARYRHRMAGQESARPADRSRRLARTLMLIPWFLPAFLTAATINTAGLIPTSSQHALQTTSVLLITVALSAIGLSTNTAALRSTGIRPVLLGLALWLAVATTSLLLQALTGPMHT